MVKPPKGIEPMTSLGHHPAPRNVDELHAASNAQRWPTSLLPSSRAERCYYDRRGASRRWVDGLQTRGGIPRWDRIRRCGDPTAAIRISDGALSWLHKWCRDRACYACARSRSRRISQCLRVAIEAKPDAPLYFITITRPRSPIETAEDAYDAFIEAWGKLRHSGAWDNVIGGVRTMEMTYSTGHARAARKIEGWHVHAHLCVEFNTERRAACPTCNGAARDRGQRCRTCCSATHRGDGSMLLEARAFIEQWAAIVGGSLRAQCAVPIDRTNVGQLAKYVTKLWELKPEHAREMFKAIAGKQLVSGFGAWSRWRSWGDVETTPAGWYTSGVALAEIATMEPTRRVDFTSTMPGVALVGGGNFRGPIRGVVLRARNVTPYSTTWRPHVPVASVTAGQIVRALYDDNRPVWERDDAPPEHAQRVEAMRLQLRTLAREQHRHGLEPPKVPWHY